MVHWRDTSVLAARILAASLALLLLLVMREGRALAVETPNEPAPAATATTPPATAATPPARGVTVDLYTIGQGSYLYSSYGHSLLCVREAGSPVADEKARCYDYGVADAPDFFHMLWTAVRSEPSFTPIAVDEALVLRTIRDQGRQIERQHLPLSDAEATKLAALLARDVEAKRPFAYHAYWANCATHLRDHLDEATGGKLRPGPSNLPKMRFRELTEDGLSGRLGELVALTLFLGAPSDRDPTPWEAMYLPFALREGVTERFGTPPERVADRVGIELPTSRALGRIAIFFLAFVLFVTVRVCVRKKRARLALGIVGGVLGTLAILTELVASVVVWPEFRHNWGLAVFLPTDFALPFLKPKQLAIYVKARLALTIALAILELVSVIGQPMLPLVALVALPFSGLLAIVRSRATHEATPSVAAGARSV